jgi:hypothetical protein
MIETYWGFNGVLIDIRKINYIYSDEDFMSYFNIKRILIK